jgi:hypothetical protein
MSAKPGQRLSITSDDEQPKPYRTGGFIAERDSTFLLMGARHTSSHKLP